MTNTSESVHILAELIRGMGQTIVYLWPITLLVLAGAAWALIVPAPRLVPSSGRGWFSVALSYLFPAIILLVGFMLRYDWVAQPEWHEPPAWRGYVLVSLLMAHVLLTATAVAVLKPRRLRAAALLTPAVWLSVCAYVPAAIAIGGVGL